MEPSASVARRPAPFRPSGDRHAAGRPYAPSSGRHREKSPPYMDPVFHIHLEWPLMASEISDGFCPHSQSISSKPKKAESPLPSAKNDSALFYCLGRLKSLRRSGLRNSFPQNSIQLHFPQLHLLENIRRSQLGGRVGAISKAGRGAEGGSQTNAAVQIPLLLQHHNKASQRAVPRSY